MLEYRKMFIDNQQLSPMHGQQSLEAPTSVDSAFGMSPIRKEKPQAKGSYTEYIDDYEKNFEALMRESVEKAKEVRGRMGGGGRGGGTLKTHYQA
jgi:hypothetical protein